MNLGFITYTYPRMSFYYVTLNGTQIGRYYTSESAVKQAIKDIQKGMAP